MLWTAAGLGLDFMEPSLQQIITGH